MGGAVCRYCTMIRAHAHRHRVWAAAHAQSTTFPRCDIHWRFLCSVCEKARHFHAVTYCPQVEKFYCIECVPRHRVVRKRFWAWSYHYRLPCPWRAEWHDALDRLEHDRRHPWQTRAAWRARKIGLDPSEEVPPRWVFRIVPAARIREADVRRGWDAVADWWVGRYSARGDINREWVIDPTLLGFLGDVRGLRILDAGCGGGYLARLLARRGARVDGVDQSLGLLRKAEAEEANAPLGVRYRTGDLANMSFFPGRTFDVVLSNMVLQDVLRLKEAIAEIHRVLKPGGRFLFSITHPAFESPVPGTWVREPEDSERIEDRKYLAVDRYIDRVGIYWAPPGKPLVPGFHRPLRDYFESLYAAGFLVARFEEPTPSKEALKRHYRVFADLLRVPIFVVVEAIRSRRASR